MTVDPITVPPPGRPRARTRWPVARRVRDAALGFDAALAVLLAVVTLAGELGESHPDRHLNSLIAGHHVPAAVPPAYLLVVVSALALAWRRRRPVRVLAVSVAAVLAFTCLGYVNGAVLINPMFAVYAVAAAVPTGRAVALALATMVSLMTATAAFNPLGTTGGGFVLIPGEVAAALLLGLWVASRRAYSLRVGEEQARRAVDTERLRIARELHDVVAHTMATINVQAGVARHLVAGQPEQAAEALEAIRQASKEGLRELRGILGILRQVDEPELRQPAPDLSQLPELVDNATRAGLAATLAVRGRRRPLAPSVELAAYRIVQESLTNALRYAGPTTATVTLSYGAGELDVEVLDHGRGARAGRGGEPSQGAGQGIAGMRERAAAAGGVLDAGPAPGGGFRVHARLPLRRP